MDNSIVVNANEKCLNKLLSYNRGRGQRVRVYLDGEYLCDIYINPKLLFKALYEATEKGAEVKLFKFNDKARLHYYSELKGAVSRLSENAIEDLIKLRDGGEYLSISAIKELHKKIGKELESANSESKRELFNRLNRIISECRQAELEQRIYYNRRNRQHEQQLQKSNSD